MGGENAGETMMKWSRGGERRGSKIAGQNEEKSEEKERGRVMEEKVEEGR